MWNKGVESGCGCGLTLTGRKEGMPMGITLSSSAFLAAGLQHIIGDQAQASALVGAWSSIQPDAHPFRQLKSCCHVPSPQSSIQKTQKLLSRPSPLPHLKLSVSAPDLAALPLPAAFLLRATCTQKALLAATASFRPLEGRAPPSPSSNSCSNWCPTTSSRS